MSNLDYKLNQQFGGKVVRKDLTKLVKGNAIVPTYVLEYLLGQYCATDDDETINQGVNTVRNIISKHFVHRDEAQLIKSTIREKGSHRIIDKVSVKLNDKKDQYEASFANLGLKNVPIADVIIKDHQKLLSSGIWCILTIAYISSDEKDATPWVVENLKPIQVSNADIEEFKEERKKFEKEEWLNILMQSIGFNPEEFSFRSKLIQLTRLVPFVENNYNLIELGPKGTGKSHIFSEMSPHGILISGGEVSKAKLFVNNTTGDIGLVGYWDVVAYDEFAGKTKKADRGLVDILKNYMANQSFSRGTHVYTASASMVYVGNTDHSVPYMLQHSNLFEALPKDYYDTAFLDRMHAYLPGWEVQKLRNEMFTENFGFIVDYLAEVLKVLRKEDRTHDYTQFFELSETITTRDKTSIAKTYSGLSKVIYPHGEMTEEDAKELLDFSIECRKRVKQQLQKMDETFNDEVVDFSYLIKSTGETRTIETLEIIEHGEGYKKTQDPIEFIPSAKKEQAVSPLLEEGKKTIHENQKGISYEKLFADYFRGATEFELEDPYIRLPYQFRNLMELMALIIKMKTPGQKIKFHLVTCSDEEHKDVAEVTFTNLQESLLHAGVEFTYERNLEVHDRHIKMNNGWTIILGRGLDIYQKTAGWYDINEYVQTFRQCKSNSVTYLRSDKEIK